MKLRYKKLHKDAQAPFRKHYNDAGYDLTAVSIDKKDKYVQYNTGIAVEIPDGYVGLIFPRSSVTKTDLMLKNCVGVIDAGYRDEISFRFTRLKGDIYQVDIRNLSESDLERLSEVFKTYSRNSETLLVDKSIGMKLTEMGIDYQHSFVDYNIGDRIGQLIIFEIPPIEWEEADELSESDRGTGKYGSTGN